MHTSDCSRYVALQRVHAAAAASLACQKESVEKIFALIERMVVQQQWRAVSLLEQQFHDETRLLVRTRKHEDDHAELQAARIFVMETCFSVLLQRRPATITSHSDTRPPYGSQWCILEIPVSAIVRAANDATGETIAQVLKQSLQVPDSTVACFENVVRLVEFDESPANLRAEQLLLRSRAAKWMGMESVCLCHKTHASATKSWALEETLITSLIQATLLIAQGGSMQRLKDAARQLVKEKFSVLRQQVLQSGAERYKDLMVKFFPVPHKRRRAQALLQVAMKFFNSEWRRHDGIFHVCSGPGCCASEQESATKASLLLIQLLVAMRPKVFSRSEWLSWSSSLPFFGVSTALHNVLPQLFMMAFAKSGDKGDEVVPANVESQGPQDAMDMLLEVGRVAEQAVEIELGEAELEGVATKTPGDMERFRAATAHSLHTTMRWMASGSVWEDVFVLRSCLDAEITLMSDLTHMASGTWEREQAMSESQALGRMSRILRLHQCEDVLKAYATILQIFESSEHWAELPQTEHFRSRIAKLMWRVGAVMYQLMQLRLQGYPYKLFELLDPNLEKNTTAARLLGERACLRDSFTKAFLEKFSRSELLTSQESLLTLEIVARRAVGTTFSTERLHSKNLRRCRARLTHQPDVKHLGLSHADSACLAWAQIQNPSQTQSDDSKGRGRPRKHSDKATDKPSTRKGAGGPWRAFVHSRLGGRPFSGPDIQALAVAYHNLSPVEREHFNQLGEAGLSHGILKPLHHIWEPSQKGTFLQWCFTRVKETAPKTSCSPMLHQFRNSRSGKK